jgi:hypothetical protein
VFRQIKDAETVTKSVVEVLDAARSAGVRVFPVCPQPPQDGLLATLPVMRSVDQRQAQDGAAG